MDYLLCIPSEEMNSRENCERVHNILARLSEKYKIEIKPEPARIKHYPCPKYFKKYRIYKEVTEREGSGEAYLQKDEEEMILSVCKNQQEQELMRSCVYAYCHSSTTVLKSFKDQGKKK